MVGGSKSMPVGLNDPWLMGDAKLRQADFAGIHAVIFVN